VREANIMQKPIVELCKRSTLTSALTPRPQKTGEAGKLPSKARLLDLPCFETEAIPPMRMVPVHVSNSLIRYGHDDPLAGRVDWCSIFSWLGSAGLGAGMPSASLIAVACGVPRQVACW
jgi:hypothetical protein